MPLTSMTGFGRGESSASGMKVVVELSSVNRKQFDVRINLPRSIASLESRVRDLIHNSISRGHITGAVNICVSNKQSAKKMSLDMDSAKAHIKQLREAAKTLKLKDDLTASTLIRFPDVIKHANIAEDTDKVWRLSKRAIVQAISALVAMRKAEGVALGKDLAKRSVKLEKMLSQIRKLAPTVNKNFQRKLKDRLKKAGLSCADTDKSFSREILLFADRSDISEEIVRLTSHFKQFKKLRSSKEPTGRTLDFICQEMFREINTIGSKANDAGISGQVVQFKTELECVREQVQNIE